MVSSYIDTHDAGVVWTYRYLDFLSYPSKKLPNFCQHSLRIYYTTTEHVSIQFYLISLRYILYIKVIFFSGFSGILRSVILRSVVLRSVILHPVFLRSVFQHSVVLRPVFLRSVFQHSVVLRSVFLRSRLLRSVSVFLRSVFLRSVFLRSVFYVQSFYVQSFYVQLAGFIRMWHLQAAAI